MPNIMDLPGIYINEGNNRFPYRRIYNKNIPNYYPPENKSKLYKDMSIDEIRFFPITMETFKTDRKTSFTGFQYLFQTSNHSTISLINDPGIASMTTAEIVMSVQRFRYFITGDDEITIDQIGDPLMPPRIFDIESPTLTISSRIATLIVQLVTQLNEWYISKQI